MRSGGRQATASPDLTTPYPVASWSPLAASRLSLPFGECVYAQERIAARIPLG
jgi:hypothetical protein